MHLRFGSRNLAAASPQYAVRAPATLQSAYEPDECCEVQIDGHWKRFRLNDHRAMFAHPGLYEQLLVDQLNCTTPQRAVGTFGEVLFDWHGSPGELRVLEIGAGNGLVAAEMRQLGASAILGIDHRPEASKAVRRDRPWAYDVYLLGRLSMRKSQLRRHVESFAPNCLVMLAGDNEDSLDAAAFAAAWNLLTDQAWVVFSMSETSLCSGRQARFQQLIRKMTELGCIQMECYRRYVHRVTMGGVPVCHVLFVARKLQPVPATI
jgi:SAM-dependent methyltransferase